MAKFLILWEHDRARLPADPKERLASRIMMGNLVKEDLESGRLKDWGAFPGEGAGYAIMEGSEQDVLIGTGRYDPFVKFKIHPVVTLSQSMESMKTLSQG